MLDAYLTYYESETFFWFLLHRIFESDKFRFYFSHEK